MSSTATREASGSSYVKELISQTVARNPGEPEFHQAIQEVLESLAPVFDRRPEYRTARILERMVEPGAGDHVPRALGRTIRGQFHINKGYRIQMNSALGPHKGRTAVPPAGQPRHPEVPGVRAGAQELADDADDGRRQGGGSDFDPKGKSDNEVMRFCQSFMTELARHIGPDTDVPAGDIGVGGREIGYLFGQYKRLRNEFTGVLTGKGLNWGGSLIRPEATGYGAVYFAAEMLNTRKETLAGKTCLVSGSGNVAQYTVEKLIELGARPVTLSDSDGFIHDEAGIDREKLKFVFQLKNERRGRIKEYADRFHGSVYTPIHALAEHNPLWSIKAHCAFPSATQNEINAADAKNLLASGVYVVSEGANMPTMLDAVNLFLDAGILYAPGKASNAGGVATSGLEMMQNSMRMSWTREEVDSRLHGIMKAIHKNCAETAAAFGTPGNYVNGANIGGFLKVADAMMDQGLV